MLSRRGRLPREVSSWPGGERSPIELGKRSSRSCPNRHSTRGAGVRELPTEDTVVRAEDALTVAGVLGRLLGYEVSYPEYGDDRKDTRMKQKQVLLTQKGGPEVLEVVEREAPEPGPGEARVKVLATGVAFADVMMRYGLYPGVPKFPYTPGYDLVGEVEDLGPNVSGVAVGQRVAALTQIGGYAQYVALPVGELVRVPVGVDAAEVASLPVNYVTAYQMLFRVAKVKPGERILVHGAAGGVGTAMLELGRLQGLEMYGTASAGKHDLVSELGGTPIDYKAEDFVERVRALTGDGMDAVFDHIGGAHVARSFGTLRRGGRLVGYGLSSGLASGVSFVGLAATTLSRIALWNTLPNGKRATFYTIYTVKRKHPEWFREDLALLLGLLAEGRIQPIVSERLPLEEVVRAHELMENAGMRGKIVLLPNG
jgi:NADPH:quinone reductase-like Zn-dependent oxidoreductase